MQGQPKAGPPIINNLFANLPTAITVDTSSSDPRYTPTVITANIYQGNGIDVASANPITETNAIRLAATDALNAKVKDWSAAAKANHPKLVAALSSEVGVASTAVNAKLDAYGLTVCGTAGA